MKWKYSKLQNLNTAWIQTIELSFGMVCMSESNVIS